MHTRDLWIMSTTRAEPAKYALAVYKDQIKEVYEINRPTPSLTKIIDPNKHLGRIEFMGKVAGVFVRRPIRSCMSILLTKRLSWTINKSRLVALQPLTH